MMWTVGLFLLLLAPARAAFGIPGTQNTISGYDNEKGPDPICWRASADVSGGTIAFPNPLLQEFRLGDNGGVEILEECPSGNRLEGFAPLESRQGERLRTGRWYDFPVEITIDRRTLGADFFVADQGALVAVQVVVCVLGQSGFCQPFVHEQANTRLEREGITTPPKRGDRHGTIRESVGGCLWFIL